MGLIMLDIDKALYTNFDNEIKEYTNSENLIDIGEGFVYWTLTNYFDLEKDEAIIALIGGSNDKDVDAFFEREGILHIIQGKGKGEIGQNLIRRFKGCIDWLKNPDASGEVNEDLNKAAEIFRDGWVDEKKVELHFFTKGTFTTEARREQSVFNTNPENTNRVSMFLHDINDILRYYRSKKIDENPLIKEKFNFDLIEGEHFIRSQKKESIVATVKAIDLVNLYKKYQDDLFFRNVRYYLGTRKGKIGDVNNNIINTAMNDQGNFWYFNNGISFVCTDFKLHNQKSKNLTLLVEGFQIINGCQTTVSIYEAYEQINGDEAKLNNLHILARFIKTAGAEDIDHITYNMNSQNPVNIRQLKSNCPIQKRLQKDFASNTKPYFYSIKPGDWQNLTSSEKSKFKDESGYRKLDNYDVAQTLYAFNTDPIYARNNREKLFPEKYSKIFRKDIHIKEILLSFEIQEIVKKTISDYSKEFNKFKKNPEKFIESDQKNLKQKEFLLYSKLILLHFIKKMFEKKYKINQIHKSIVEGLLNNKLNARIKQLLDYCIAILSYSKEIEQQDNLPRFFKRPTTTNILWLEVEKEIEKDRAKKADPLEILPNIKL